MKLRYPVFGLLAAAGTIIGVLIATVVVPYGPLSHTVFAGLYHNGGATPAPAGHFAIDCNPGGAINENCVTSGGTHRVDVVFEDNSAAGTINAFEFRIRNTNPIVIDAVADANELNGNPDFNEVGPGFTGTWNCNLSAPSPEDDTGALVGDEEHRLACFVGSGLGPPHAISTGVVLASIDYTVGAFGTSTLSFTWGLLGDNDGIELVNCEGVDAVIGTGDDPCFGATVQRVAEPSPGPPTVTPTSTPIPDADADSVLDADDNCVFEWNPNQENNDRNFIDLPPTEPFDDATLANSDAQGDACDTDDDNDGLTDEAETAGAPCVTASGATLPLVADTDGDLALDGAECNTGTDPNSASSKPTLLQCGSTMDTDGDGILNFREVCYYNTDPLNANTDGDSCGDGREVASINQDQQVNVIDLQQVAQSSGPSTDPDYIVDFDITKNGTIDVIDLQQVAARSGPCP